MLDRLLGDLIAEHEVLDNVVEGLTEVEWKKETPAEGWTIRDQVSHLAFFDERAVEAASDTETFLAGITQAASDPDKYMTISLARDRAELPLEWWRQARQQLIASLKLLHPKARLPWYGPPMSVMTFATARLMETWAHGQDVFDALNLKHEPTERLRHVADLGYRTRSFSFRNRNMAVPQEEVRLELTSPQGELWTWGEDDAREWIRGNAEEFCLVVTQRRHVSETCLEVEGAGAREWMKIAQAFAGPPGKGRMR